MVKYLFFMVAILIVISCNNDSKITNVSEKCQTIDQDSSMVNFDGQNFKVY